MRRVELEAVSGQTLWWDRFDVVVVDVRSNRAVLVPRRDRAAGTAAGFSLSVLPELLTLISQTVETDLPLRTRRTLQHLGVRLSSADTQPLFRGVWMVVEDHHWELRPPGVCDHTSQPFANCPPSPSWSGQVPLHPKPHLADCGCVCAGITRWTHRPGTPLPAAVTHTAGRFLTGVLKPWVGDPWWWWSKFCERATSKPGSWLDLWASLVTPDIGRKSDLEGIDTLCDLALGA